MPSLTILQKGLIVVVTPFVVQMAFVATVANVQVSQVEAQVLSTHSKEVSAQSRNVLTSLVDVETFVRGFAITDDPASLMTFDRTAGLLPAELDRLVSIVADNPSQHAQARQIAAQATALLAYHNETVHRFRRGDRDEAVGRMKSPVDKQQMDALRDAIHAFDREDGLRELSQLVLEASGYKILSSRNGGEAVQICHEYAGVIHLLFTDVVMPKISGRQLADLLVPSRPSMKVLYMSGYTDDTMVRHGIQDAGTNFLPKPFTPIALVKKVRDVLDGTNGHQDTAAANGRLEASVGVS